MITLELSREEFPMILKTYGLEGASSENANDSRRGDNAGESLLCVSEFGRRLAESDSNVNAGRGRINKLDIIPN